MKEANITINANTATAAENIKQLGEKSAQTTTQMMGLSQVAMTVAETISGSFAIATGAAGLLAGENERLQQIAVKANSAIALAIGIRQIAEQKAKITTLAGTAATQANAIVTKMAAGIYKTLGIAVTGASRSMKILKGAIVSTGIGALVIGLGMLVEKLMSATDETDDLADAQERYNKLIADSLTDSKKQVALQEQLLRADTEAEKNLIKKKIAYEEEKAALENLISAKVLEDELNKKLVGKEIIIAYDINGQAITKMAEASTSANDALEAHIEKLNAMDMANLELEKSLSKTGEIIVKTEEKIKTLTEEERLFIENKINTSKLLIDATISEYDAALFTAEGEIELMYHKLETFILTEDEKLLMKERIAERELALANMVANEEIRLSGKVTDKKLSDEKAVQGAKMALAKASADIMGNLSVLLKEGSAAAKAAGLAEIAINTGVGFIQGLIIAQEVAKNSSLAAPVVFAAFYASQVAAVLASAAQAKAILQSGGSGGGGGGGGITFTAPYVPEGAAQAGGAPETGGGEGGQPLQAFVVSNEITNQQALDSELEIQSTL